MKRGRQPIPHEFIGGASMDRLTRKRCDCGSCYADATEAVFGQTYVYYVCCWCAPDIRAWIALLSSVEPRS